MKRWIIRVLHGVPLPTWRVKVLVLLLFAGAVPLAEAQTLFRSDDVTSQLITINTTTGAGTAAGAIGFRAGGGLSFCDFLIVSIPTLNQLGMIIMAGVLGLFAVIAIFAFRRRNEVKSHQN